MTITSAAAKPPKPASAKLVKLAVSAAKATAKAGIAQQKWVSAFKAEYGHDQISDGLVELIDYCLGDTGSITAEYIAANSAPAEGLYGD